MTKIIASLAVLLAAGGLLAGCEQSSQLNQSGQQQLQAGQNNDTGMRNRNRNRFVKSDYVVDESDNVRAKTLLDSIEKADLSKVEKDGLVQMREEEKLAHDVYVTLYEKWGQNIFNNISKSEQTHTNTIKYLLERYNIEDPVKSVEVGKFTDPKMKELYDSLVAQGEKSLVDALVVGATVEDLDIKDLEDLLPKTDNKDIRTAYQNLNKGSRNHLRAFMRNLERNGGSYTPQFISRERFDEILAGEQERGSVDSQGKQSGLGQGNGGKNGQGNHRGNGQDYGHRQGYGRGGHGNGQGGGRYNR